MATILLGLLAFHGIGACAFVYMAKTSSVLVDEDERPIITPQALPGEPLQVVRRIKTVPSS